MKRIVHLVLFTTTLYLHFCVFCVQVHSAVDIQNVEIFREITLRS